MGEFDTINFAEYSYSRANEGKALLGKALMCALYALFEVAFFLVCYITRVIPLFALCPVFLWILVFFTWRYVSFDYYLEFHSGILDIGTVRGGSRGRKKKLLHSVKVKDALFAARYKNPEELGDVKHIYDYSSSKKALDRIALVLEDGARYALIFDSTTKLAGLIASYCPRGKELKGQKFIA
jgi:hypothetical protein